MAVTLGADSPRFALLPAYAPYVKTPEGVVGDVLVWHGAGAAPHEFLDQKAMLLQALVEFLPRRIYPALHDIVLADLVTLLAATGQSADDHAAWFLHVNNLLDYARRADRGEHARVLGAFEASNNVVMHAYGALERVAPKRKVKS